MSSNEIEAQLQARNAEIARLLRRAREAAGRTQAECAEYLNISRQMYNRIENANAKEMIGVAQYEALLAYLNAPAHWLLPSGEGGAAPKYISVEAVPGQTLHITVSIAEGGSAVEGAESVERGERGDSAVDGGRGQ